jgi:hypothetical protein
MDFCLRKRPFQQPRQYIPDHGSVADLELHPEPFFLLQPLLEGGKVGAQSLDILRERIIAPACAIIDSDCHRGAAAVVLHGTDVECAVGMLGL